jgi:hypothetical protein
MTKYRREKKILKILLYKHLVLNINKQTKENLRKQVNCVELSRCVLFVGFLLGRLRGFLDGLDGSLGGLRGFLGGLGSFLDGLDGCFGGRLGAGFGGRLGFLARRFGLGSGLLGVPKAVLFSNDLLVVWDNLVANLQRIDEHNILQSKRTTVTAICKKTACATRKIMNNTLTGHIR